MIVDQPVHETLRSVTLTAAEVTGPEGCDLLRVLGCSPA
jgi:hypothetical protein